MTEPSSHTPTYSEMQVDISSAIFARGLYCFPGSYLLSKKPAREKTIKVQNVRCFYGSVLEGTPLIPATLHWLGLCPMLYLLQGWEIWSLAGQSLPSSRLVFQRGTTTLCFITPALLVSREPCLPSAPLLTHSLLSTWSSCLYRQPSPFLPTSVPLSSAPTTHSFTLFFPSTKIY